MTDAAYLTRTYTRGKARRIPRRTTCAICGSRLRLVHDHCHETKVIRGTLCANCNAGLGFFKDNPQLLRHAAMYLEMRGENRAEHRRQTRAANRRIIDRALRTIAAEAAAGDSMYPPRGQGAGQLPALMGAVPRGPRPRAPRGGADAATPSEVGA